MSNLVFLAGEAGATGDLSVLTKSMSALLDLAGVVLDFILANPILALLFVSGFASVVVGLISMFKHA